MFRNSHGIFVAAIIAIAVLFSVPARAKDCPSFSSEIYAAYHARDTQRAAHFYREAERIPVCTGDQLAMLGRKVAKLWYKGSFAGEIKLTERKNLLKKALTFGRPWQILAALADMEKKRKRYAQATRYYQEALDDITDETFNRKAPKPKIIASIVNKARISRMLAGGYVKTTITRSGEPGGLARVRWRGFTSRRTAVPVQFEYRKASFNENGFAAVRDMLNYLQKQGSPAITLIGHTDPRGGSKFNKRLSKKRAQMVMIWLKKGGYNGRIRIAGRGKTQPFKPDDPGSYTQQERWQLDRRVDLVRE